MHQLSVCFTGLERMACGDEGADGNLGQPTYSRVLISPLKLTDTKTFSLRFLTVGTLSLSFSLRAEESFPGKHHCNIGKLLDQVRLEVNVAVSPSCFIRLSYKLAPILWWSTRRN